MMVNHLSPFQCQTESSRAVSWPQRCSAWYSQQMLSDAFRDCESGINIRYRSDGKLFNLRKLQAVTKIKETIVRDLLFADDCALNAGDEQEMQQYMDKLSSACDNFSLTISTKKLRLCTSSSREPIPRSPDTGKRTDASSS